VAKKSKGLNPALEEALAKLLQEVMADPSATLTDKTKVIDRVIKLEALKQKADLDEWGAGFMNSDDDEA
jgi:hypothetical protein